MSNLKTEYLRWLNSEAVPDELRSELRDIEGDEEQISARFYAPLEFGTAGLRGIMGAGVNRMNVLVVRQATQAMARLILREGGAGQGCAICHDCRHKSREFAEEAACVMAANGIRVRLFDDMRPTPELSFCIREYGCMAGINITASHNPKEYNGYKVYWSDGAQLPPKQAADVAREMRSIDVLGGARTMDFDEAVSRGLITPLGCEADERYYEEILKESVKNDETAAQMAEMKVAYTPFHGAGAKAVPEILRRSGIGCVACVDEQMVPDGNFPTVESPNPEEPAGFAMVLELAQKEGADIAIATDPDSDRVGAMVRHLNRYEMISGNQMGVLLTDYILSARSRAGTLPDRAAIIKTIVTTELARSVAESYGAACVDTFTGFKFMAEKIAEYEKTGEHEVVFSFEESYGYMPGTFVRDKDAVSSSMLIAEMTAYHKAEGRSPVDALEQIYARHGYYDEETINLKMPGRAADMERLMERFRKDPPADIAGRKLVAVCDYLGGTRCAGGVEERMELSGSDVLKFELSDGADFLVRPSGTEPKIKFYILARGKTRDECAAAVRELRKYVEKLEI